jgi:DNA polymerase-3 subunit beta
MKFNVSSNSLLNVLQATGRVISNKNTLPILDYFLLELSADKTLKVTASDLETTMIGVIEVDSVEQDGTIAVPRMVVDSLKEFSDQPLTIEASQSEITISWLRGKLAIPCTSGHSYPKAYSFDEENINHFDIESGVLLGAINKTLFAAGDDEMRPVMSGIYVNLEGSNLTFVATDTHKLVKYCVKDVNNNVNGSLILAKKPATLLKNILSKGEDPVSVDFNAKNAIFKFNKHTLICRLIEGNYPNYNAVIPVNNPSKITVDRADFINTIRRVAVCSNQTTNLIKIEATQNSLNITAQDIDYSASANETLPCSYEGAPIAIGFKSTFLLEIFNNLESADILIELADKSRPGVFRPIIENADDEMLVLLMPIV